MELRQPADYSPALRPAADRKNAARLKLLLKLIKRQDVDTLINACDAGREGELIFRYIVQYANASKTIQRLWLQSMTQGYPRSLRAIARRRVDAPAGGCGGVPFRSRLAGGHQRHPRDDGVQLEDGRVPPHDGWPGADADAGDPRRARGRIKTFVPRDYWEIHGTFAAKAGEYSGRWIDESFQEGRRQHMKAERLWDAAIAQAIRFKCLGKPGSSPRKPSRRQAPRLLYDLTSLQREANSRFGFSAKTTLSLAQALYEQHKVLTYPRTDSAPCRKITSIR